MCKYLSDKFVSICKKIRLVSQQDEQKNTKIYLMNKPHTKIRNFSDCSKKNPPRFTTGRIKREFTNH